MTASIKYLGNYKGDEYELIKFNDVIQITHNITKDLYRSNDIMYSLKADKDIHNWTRSKSFKRILNGQPVYTINGGIRRSLSGTYIHESLIKYFIQWVQPEYIHDYYQEQINNVIKLVHDKLEIIADELVTSSLYSELINADNVTNYVIKFWVRNIEDNGTIWVKSFCGLIENWPKAKYNPEVDKLIIDEKASCSINNFRAAIKNISHMVFEMKGRKFRIRVDDLDTVIMLFKEGLSKITSNAMHSIVQQLRSVV